MTKETPDEESIKVTRLEPVFVHPAKENNHEFYFLSNLDQNIAVIMKTVHCYKASERSSDDAGQVIREALEKVMVHFYPYDGSLAISEEGKLIVRCDRRGVPFVEAVAECDLDELGDISIPDPVKLGELIYTCPEAKNLLETPLLTVQVTKFKCGGFVLGIAMNHCLADGISAVGFLQSWAQIARDLSLINRPFLDRSVLRARSPPKINFPHHEYADIEDVSNLSSLYSSQELHYGSFAFDPEKLNRLKQTATENGSVQTCTSFTVLTAFIWRARTKALNMGPHQKTKLLFAVDGRNRVEPPLPVGFFGNGIVLACCMCQAAELVDRSLSFAVQLVQAAIREITDEYIRSAIDYFEVTRARPSMTGTLLVTAWTRLGFVGVDYGWGEPVQTGPAELPQKDVALFLPHEESKSRVVVMGLPTSSMDTFKELVNF